MYLSTPITAQQATILNNVTVHITWRYSTWCFAAVRDDDDDGDSDDDEAERTAMDTLFCGSYSSRFTSVTKAPSLLQVFHSIHKSSQEPHNRLCKQHVLAHFITRSWTNCVKPMDRVTWCHVLFTRDRSGTARSTRFGNAQSDVLPTQCIYVFCLDLRTNSDYFPIQY